MKKVNKKELVRIHDALVKIKEDVTATDSVHVRAGEWINYQAAMKDLKMSFSALIRHMLKESGVWSKELLVESPLPKYEACELIKETEALTKTRTYRLSSLKLYFLKEYKKKHRISVSEIALKWLSKNGYR